MTLVVEAIYSKSGEGLHRFVDPADSEGLSLFAA